MAGTNTTAWDEFVRRAQEFIDTGRLEREEVNYKVLIGRQLADAREAMFSGSRDWARQVDAALPSGNIIHYVPKSNFCNWLRGSPDESRMAFQAIWARDDLSVNERIRSFNKRFPNSVLGTGAGAGTRMNVISVLLMGLDAQQYPPFAYRLFMNSFRRTGYPLPWNADEAGLYEHALGFLDQFIEAAAGHGLTLRHRLDAQSIVWKFVDDLPPLPSVDGPPPSPNGLDSLADELTLPKEFLEEIDTLLEDKRQVIFQGPPGTGKTYVAQKLANHLAGSEDRITLVQFHPSYSYEDFVQGFRPSLENGQPGFELRNGPLLKAAEQARKDKDAKHFLIIDEINRGNLARILGELYFLLEYRDEEISLQYQGDTGEKFSLPDNLYIIGTMNTADRSIALVDLALRRRFYFVEFHPDDDPVKDVLRNWLKKNADGMGWVADVVDAANDKLKNVHQAAIGPSYFMKPGLDKAKVELIWKHSVLPYIEERLFGEREERMGEFKLDELRASVTSGSQPDSGSQSEDSARNGGNSE